MLDFFKRGSGSSPIENVEHTLVAMLQDGLEVFQASSAAVFGGGTSKDVKREVKGTDREINEAQREVRRALMMHSAVAGPSDLPLVLAYMSVVKDAERVGDYAKNIYELAKYGVDFAAAPDRADLERYREAVAQLIGDAAAVFDHRDTDRAHQLVAKADGFLDEYDDHVKSQAKSEGTAFDAVTRVLYFRYLKRITAHVMNLMTALILPVDQLDYYDEAKDDRETPPDGDPSRLR